VKLLDGAGRAPRLPPACALPSVAGLTAPCSPPPGPQKETPLVLGIVDAATEVLRAAGVGKEMEKTQKRPEIEDGQPPIAAGDIEELLRRLEADYRERAYFITGDIDGSIYAPDCYFADPTISFRGLEKWRSNLRLLVPFLIKPRIELRGIVRKDAPSMDAPAGRATLRARWRLVCGLKLFWRPVIDIEGATVYELGDDNTRIESHVEEWEIPGWQAILQIFTTGDASVL